jgi:5-formyltetrahydrofolate cyclo-ligase
MDNRDAGHQHVNAGGEVARPVSFANSQPAEFWRWHPGMPMQKGIWNIPSPCNLHVLTPDALIIPLVGVDS